MSTDDAFEGIDAAFALRLLLAPIEPYFGDQRVTEICVNRPGILFVECEGRWQRVEDDTLSLEWAHALVIAAAVAEGLHVGGDQPFLAASLPQNIRLAAVLPPACKQNRVLLSFRVARRATLGHDSFAWGRHTEFSEPARPLSTAHLHTSEFLHDHVRQRKNILVVGDTGAGKTAMLRSLLSQVDRSDRLVTLEDVQEIVLSREQNHAQLFYGNHTGIDASTCLREALRLRPDRVILSECRGAEAFDFLQILMSGHRGAMTTLHADSSDHAIERLALMARSHPASASLPQSALIDIAARHIDTIIHVSRDVENHRSADIKCLH